MPVSTGSTWSSSVNASSPPAEAPMATMGTRCPSRRTSAASSMSRVVSSVPGGGAVRSVPSAAGSGGDSTRPARVVTTTPDLARAVPRRRVATTADDRAVRRGFEDGPGLERVLIFLAMVTSNVPLRPYAPSPVAAMPMRSAPDAGVERLERGDQLLCLDRLRQVTIEACFVRVELVLALAPAGQRDE